MKTYTHLPLGAARKKLSFTIDDVMRRLYAEHQVEISRSTLISWEQGETNPDLEKLPPLLAILKLKLDDLYEQADA